MKPINFYIKKMSNKKVVIIFILTAVIFFLAGVTAEKCFIERKTQQQNIQKPNELESDMRQTSETEDKNISLDSSISREDTQKQFVQNLYKKFPNTYIIKDANYYESLDSEEAIKATEISPCNPEDKDSPNVKPLCFTTITVFTENNKTANLEDYIQSNWLMSDWSKGNGGWGAGLVRTTYEDSIPMAFTPQRFMCLGTGGETCMRERYVYHMPSGYNVVAEISLWPDHEDLDGTKQTGGLEYSKMWDLYYEYEKALGGNQN